MEPEAWNLYEPEDRGALLPALVELWEASVRATHLFLNDDEVKRIKGYVPQALAAVPHLVAADRSGRPAGFLGVDGERIEMLFLAPEARGRGLGRALLAYAVRQYGAREVTVNEQNPQAVGFYEHMGFRTYRRTDRDEEGGPYPLLYMRLTEGTPVEGCR